MLDTNIASALRKIISNISVKKRVSVEEQRAQKHDRIRRRKQIAFLIYDHFRATSAHDEALDLSDLPSVSSKRDDIQDFDTRWDQALSAVSETPNENVLEGS